MTDVKKKLNLARATVAVKQQELQQPVDLVGIFQKRGIYDLTGSDNDI